MGSIRFRGVCDSDEYYALGWTKKKNIRIRNIARQPESNLVSVVHVIIKGSVYQRVTATHVIQ